MKKLVVISAGLSTPSSTRMLADKMAQASSDELLKLGEESSVEYFELRDYAHEITDHFLTGFPSKRLAEMLTKLAESSGAIFVTPVFKASYSGLFKSFIDSFEPELLEGKPVFLGATGGSNRHSLVLDHALKPLFSYLHAAPVSTGIFAATSDWGADAEAAFSLSKRIERGASEFASSISQSKLKPTVDPYSPEAYELTGGFEALLNS